MDIESDKSKLRKKFRDIRMRGSNNNDQRILSKVIITLKKLFPADKCQGYIGIYWPINKEIDLRALKMIKSYSIALPASKEKNKLSYYPWSNTDLKKDINGIPAPLTNNPLNPQEVDLLLVPALAIDKKGYRLGYGGGYFDRLRSNPNWRNVKALLIINEDCISVNDLPRDDWDIPFDGWISEKGFHQSKT